MGRGGGEGGEGREKEGREKKWRRGRRKMAVPNPGNLMLQKTSYMCIDPPRWSLLLGFLHEVDEAGKVD